MPTNSQQSSSNHDEIDLIYLFSKLGEFIKKAVLGLIDIIGAVLVFILRKWYYFIIAVILTIITALALDKISDPYYYSELVMRSNATRNQPIMSSLDKLGEYAASNNYAALSKELNLSLEDASKIKELGTSWYYDIGGDGIFDGIDRVGRFLADTNVVMLDSVFLIYTSIYDPNILEKLEVSLVNYLEANPYLKALNEQRLSNLEARVTQTEYEIAKLDSLQRREYYTDTDQLRQREGQVVFTSERTVRIYHNDMFRLLRLKQEYERDLNIFSDVVSIVEGFTIPANADNVSIHFAKKLIWYYMGLALLLAIILKFRRKIWVR